MIIIAGTIDFEDEEHRDIALDKVVLSNKQHVTTNLDASHIALLLTPVYRIEYRSTNYGRPLKSR